MPDPPPSRIVVLGCSGSGKSTLAAELARRYALPYVATDDVYWRPDWTPTPEPEVRAWLVAQAARPAWVLDGNFDAQREVLWGRAELAVWLDLPWATTVWRMLWRNLRWWVARTPIWGGLRMTLPKLVSGVRHAARGHAQKRASYPALLASFPNLTSVRIRSPGELRAWLLLPGEKEVRGNA
jgi:hypothetical protein